MVYQLKSENAVKILEEGLRGLAIVKRTPLRDSVARLQDTATGRILWLDTDSPDEDLAWVLLDVLRVLGFGCDPAATSARQVPRLHSVG